MSTPDIICAYRRGARSPDPRRVYWLLIVALLLVLVLRSFAGPIVVTNPTADLVWFGYTGGYASVYSAGDVPVPPNGSITIDLPYSPDGPHFGYAFRFQSADFSNDLTGWWDQSYLNQYGDMEKPLHGAVNFIYGNQVGGWLVADVPATASSSGYDFTIPETIVVPGIGEVTLPSWATGNPELAFFFFGVAAASGICLVRSGLRWFKRVDGVHGES